MLGHAKLVALPAPIIPVKLVTVLAHNRKIHSHKMSCDCCKTCVLAALHFLSYAFFKLMLSPIPTLNECLTMLNQTFQHTYFVVVMHMYIAN